MAIPADQQLALKLCRALAVDTGGRPQQWRMVSTIAVRARIRDQREIDRAVAVAAASGWITVEAGHSVCLTDLGRQAAG